GDVFAVFDDTDDFNIGVDIVAGPECEMAAERAATFKEPMHKGLVDYCDFRGRWRVGLAELAARNERYTHGREVIGPNPILSNVGILVGGGGVAFDGGIGGRTAVGKDCYLGGADRSHAGLGGDCMSDPVGQVYSLSRGIAIELGRDRELNNMIGANADIQALQVVQAKSEERSGD